MIDLHCHWLPGIDDGVRSVDEAISLLKALHAVGFRHVVATPHMRPNMFPNEKPKLIEHYEACRKHLPLVRDIPEVSLACEHFFDDVVYPKLLNGHGLAYNQRNCLLVELPSDSFPQFLPQRFFDLRRKGIRVILAHPERYSRVWDSHTVLDPIVDGGTALLLDVAALVGKYGRKPERAALRLVEEGYYYAACSDSHRPSDVEDVARGIERLRTLVGDEEADFMLSEGPQNILEGKIDT